MDDTQQSRTSEAAATRKRRSSILKSQRPPRTPFSELEFNVATPTDTTKSRRVSFSRRTGVAEFVTNEGTTTWKNFYEEHNKSLESSGNESANAARQPIGHIGKRIFEQQFEEVEAVDFISTPNNPGMCIDTSHNVNYVHQITGEDNLGAPQSNFELSTFTDNRSKLFGDDLAIQTMGEVTDSINVNFSVMQPLDGNDDLDEIQKDLQRAQSNVVCHGPFGAKDMSEYIEVDLNMTQAVKNHDQSDMSITDTVHSPKVQDVSKSFSNDKKYILSTDWQTDKENIVTNPYVAPRESANFAINEEPNKVLVFDGKRLTVQAEDDDLRPKSKDNFRQTLLPNVPPENTPQRKTIVLNVNDDLPNFVEDMHISKIEPLCTSSDKSKYDFNGGDMSMTRPLAAKIEENQPRRRTVLFNENTDEISITQALPANIFMSKQDNNTEKRKTIVYDNDIGDISLTQALPNNVILLGKTVKRRTIVYDNDMGNVSFTQAVPSNIILAGSESILERQDRLTHDTNCDNCSVPDTSEVPDKRKTIVFDNDTANVSITQAIPTNIIEAQTDKRRTIVYEEDTGNIFITKAVPCNIILPEHSDRRKTIVYDRDTCNISITQSVPTSVILLDGKDINNANESNISFTQAIPTKILQDRTELSRRTVVFESDSGNISIIRSHTDSNDDKVTKNLPTVEKRRTMVIEDNAGDLILGDEAKAKRQDSANISITEAVPTRVIIQAPLDGVDNTYSEMSMRQSAKEEDVWMTEVVCSEDVKTMDFNRESEMSFIKNLPPHIEHEEKLRVYELSNFSTNKPIPSNLTAIVTGGCDKLDTDLAMSKDASGPVGQNVFVYQISAPHTAPEKQSQRVEQGDSKTGDTSVYNIVTEKSTSEDNDIQPNSEENEQMNQDIEDNQALPETKELSLQEKSSEVSEDVKACTTDDLVAYKMDINKADKEKSSILDELLDMSTTSLDAATDDKGFMAHVESVQSIERRVEEKPVAKIASAEEVFYITMDSDEEAQTDKATKVEAEPSPAPVEALESSTLALEYKKDKHPRIVENLQKKLIKLKDKLTEKSKSKNRHYEQIKSPEINKNEKQPEMQLEEHLSITKASESFKSANDTKELLDMLSEYTDKQTEEVNEKPPSPILVKGRMALENKCDVGEPRRLSFAPSRQSIVISREDLLSNISMAQAALQQSRLEDTELEDPDDTADKSMSPQKKTVRLSDEVVKTLQFDEDEGSDASMKSDSKLSPLKKTAFGESSYMTESDTTKSKVIPGFLKDVSDGIKELMLDLVKPMADVMPYEAVNVDKGVKKSPSVCSTQVQANLIASSQIDVTTDLYSNPESVYEMKTVASSSENTMLGGLCRALKKPIKMLRSKDAKSPDELSTDTEGVACVHGFGAREQTGPVIVFDHHNPLNNILLEPMDYSVTHRYNPKPSTETLCGSDRSPSALKVHEREYEVGRLSAVYDIPSALHTETKSPKEDTYNAVSSTSTVDQAVEAKLLEVMDSEVNTVIVMKGNKELLETSSSLTLVDDALVRSTFDVHIDTQSSSHAEREGLKKKSPVKVIYKLDEDADLGLEQVADLAANDGINRSKVKKRSYSPSKRVSASNVDVTPKPISKMQRVSTGQFSTVESQRVASRLTAERDDCEQNEVVGENARHLHEKRRSPRRTRHGVKDKKPGTTITVQQLITEYHIEASVEAEAAHLLTTLQPRSDTSSAEPNTRSHSEELERSVEVVSSFASSKQVGSVSSEVTRCSRATSGALRIDWHPELINELSSKNLLECDSGTNVVAKIDMLPFMGSPECEWDSSSGDTWTFRLLHGRLRLAVRLAHRHDNGARTCVRADTPVITVAVDPVHHDKKNTIAVLCVSFACSAMRALAARGCGRAAEVPALLRRAAAVARVALRWGRAMYDARQHLAYTLAADGALSLKVANIPLRSVWEVTMRVALAGDVGDVGEEVPWPRAHEVRVSRLVSQCAVPAAEVRRALAAVPADWGHVPRTLWRIFRYLKHKTRDDDLLLGL